MIASHEIEVAPRSTRLQQSRNSHSDETKQSSVRRRHDWGSTKRRGGLSTCGSGSWDDDAAGAGADRGGRVLGDGGDRVDVGRGGVWGDGGGGGEGHGADLGDVDGARDGRGGGGGCDGCVLREGEEGEEGHEGEVDELHLELIDGLVDWVMWWFVVCVSRDSTSGFLLFEELICVAREGV